MIVSVGALKGGVGKSTTAWVLAHLLAEFGAPTVLIDGDRQGSVSTWHRRAVEIGDPWPEALTVEPWRQDHPIPPPGLVHVVIDTPPGDEARLRAAVTLSDVVIVPVGARDAEVQQLGPTVDVLDGAAGPRGVAWAVLLTMVEGGTLEERQAPEDIAAADIPLLSTVIPYRAAIRRVSSRVPDLGWARQVGPYRDLLAEITEEPAHAAP